MDEQSRESAAPANAGKLSPPARDNLDLLNKFKDREEAQISGAQLIIERISAFFGSPAYFAFALAFIFVWMLVNSYGAYRASVSRYTYM